MSEQAESIPTQEAIPCVCAANHEGPCQDPRMPVKPPPSGHVCEICTEPEPFDERTKAVAWKSEDGVEHWAHAGCFHRVRADEQVKLLKSTQEVLACLLAAWGGTAKVTQAHIARAIASGFRISQEECPGGFRLRLGDRLPEEPAKAAPSEPPAAPAPERIEA